MTKYASNIQHSWLGQLVYIHGQLKGAGETVALMTQVTLAAASRVGNISRYFHKPWTRIFDGTFSV